MVRASGNSMLCHTTRRLRYFAATTNIVRRYNPVELRAKIGGAYVRHVRLYRVVRSGRPEAAAAEAAEHLRNAMRSFLQMHSEDLPAGVPRAVV